MGLLVMIGNKSGFVAMCKVDDDIPNFMGYHYYTFSRRQFRAFLKQCADEHSELYYILT